MDSGNANAGKASTADGFRGKADRAIAQGAQVAKLNITASIACAIGSRVQTLDEGSSVVKPVDFFDVLGREVELLVNQELQAGSYKIDWNADNFPSGVYFYRLETENYVMTKQMILVK